MHSFLRKFVSEWRQLEIGPKSPLIAGVSGGADSCALLAALTGLRGLGKIENEIIAAHFNHGFRNDESDRDEEFVGELADRVGASFVTDRMEQTQSKSNLEEVARVARYDFLERCALKAGSNIILTAHTVNDQAETLILNLVRGSGVDGLSAMPVSRRVHPNREIRLIRPLLKWARREMTEDFCRERKIKFRSDSMNDDVAHLRIRVRNEIIPALKSVNPKIVESLARSARLVADHRSVYDWLCEQNEEISAMSKNQLLSVAGLKRLPPAAMREVIRRWLSHQLDGLRRVGAVHLNSIESLVTSVKSGRTVELPGNILVTKSAGKLKLTSVKVEK